MGAGPVANLVGNDLPCKHHATPDLIQRSWVCMLGLRLMRILTLLLACGLPGLLMAQQPKDAARLNGAAEDSIDQTLSARTELMNRLHVRGMLPESWRTTLVDGREATLDTLGLDLALTYDALAMGAINTADEWGSSAGDLSLTARWNLLKYLSGRPLILATPVRNRSAYGDLAPSQLRTETNAAWGL